MNCDVCRIVWYPWTPPPCDHAPKGQVARLVASLIRDEKAVSPRPDGYIARWLEEQ